MQLSDILRLPEKTWTPKNNGVQTIIKAVGQTTTKSFDNADGSQTLQYRQPVTITDLAGHTAKIMHQTNYPEGLLAGASVGQAGTWRLKWYRDQRQVSHIVGYVTELAPNTGMPAQEWQLPQTAPPVAPQSLPQPAQATNYPQRGMQMPDTYAYPVTPATQARIAASVAAECAARIMGTAPLETPTDQVASMLIQIAIPIKEWILNNRVPESVVEAPLDNPPQATDDDIPWQDEH